MARDDFDDDRPYRGPGELTGLDKFFANTPVAVILAVVSVFCCPLLGLVLGGIGMAICKNPDSKRNALITLVPAFPQGTRIVVVKAASSILVGHTGMVSQANHINHDKPQVILLFDKFKRKIKPLLLDLVDEKEVEIQFAPI